MSSGKWNFEGMVILITHITMGRQWAQIHLERRKYILGLHVNYLEFINSSLEDTRVLSKVDARSKLGLSRRLLKNNFRVFL